MQVDTYVSQSKTETHEKRTYRLNQKWMIEAELWLVFLIIIELASIYRLAVLHDNKREIIAKYNIDEQKVLGETDQ